VASELGVALYRIDLSQVFSKWVGETEKHLGALFDEAEATGAALLFDEADALFAKRTEVRSSNDRYANMESAFLLQRIEEFTGLCFLTTNMDRSIDDAFIRRMAMHLRFSMPSVDEREAIWRSAIPEAAPLASDVSLSALAARFEISGGAIRNAALRAAYRAAHAKTSISQTDLIQSAEQESAASGVLTRQTTR
jgi:SpoVK/Ycf46/Vps4 family AAA+-type ATPase